MRFHARWLPLLAWSGLTFATGRTYSLEAPPMGTRPGTSAEEVAARRELIRKMALDSLPGDSTIRMLLESEKFFRRHSVSFPSEAELQAGYQAFIKELPPGSRVSFEEARPLVEMQLLLARKENHNALRASSSSRMGRPPPGLQSDSSGAGDPRHASEFPLRELQLTLQGEQCLAGDTLGLECILTVADFNREAMNMNLERRLGLDSARRTVMDKALNVRYYAGEARRKGHADLPEIKQKIANRLRGTRPGEIPDIDSAKLEGLYRQMFDSLFRRHEEVELDLIGATDSALIDSLHRALSSIPPSRARQAREAVSRLPWIRRRSDELPASLSLPADTLPLGGLTRPLRTPYGWFLLRVAGIRNIPERSFAEARPQLYQMAVQGFRAIPEADLEREARDLYKQEASRFLSPDTLLLNLWLGPPEWPEAGRLLPDPRRKPPAGFKVRSTDLPSILLSRLEPVRKGTGKRTDTLGPVKVVRNTPLGAMAVQILGRKPGGKLLPYAQVRKEIISILRSRPRTPLDVPTGAWESLQAEEVLAHSYWVALMQSTPKPTEKEAQQALREKKVPAPFLSEVSHLKPAEAASQWLFDQRWRKGQSAWKQGLWVDWQALRGG